MSPRTRGLCLLVATALGGILLWYWFVSRPQIAPSPLVLLPAQEIPQFTDELDREGLLQALDASIRFLSRRDGSERLPLGGGTVTVKRLRHTLSAFAELLNRRLSAQEFRSELARRFDVYRLESRDGGGRSEGPLLVTGYFQPLLKAVLEPSPDFPYPLYGLPEDLVRITLADFDPSLPQTTLWGRVSGRSVVPYFTREQIDLQGQTGEAPVLAWLASPVDGLMLHIQGSGVLQFPDGSQRYIHYAASNGRPYGSVGKWLIEQGIIEEEEADWPGIRSWAERNPRLFLQAAANNPRYIFFQWEREGPLGSLGEVLTPLRSVALDPTFYPAGALCYLKTVLPRAGDGRVENETFQGFTCYQDTGSAIKGPFRLDLYCGDGSPAGTLAGRLRAPGSLFLLLSKEDFLP